MLVNDNRITYKRLNDYYIKSGDFYDNNVIEHNGARFARDMQSLKMPKTVVDDWMKLILSETELIDETFKTILDINSMDHKLFIKTSLAYGQALALFVNQKILYFTPLNYTFENGVLVIEYDIYTYKIINNKKIWVIRRVNNETNETKDYKLNYKPYEVLILQNDIELPNGKSIFYDAIDIIEQIDLTYTDMNDERDMSKPMIIASEEAYETSVEVPANLSELSPGEAKAKTKLFNWLPKTKRVFKGLKGNLDKIPIQKFTFEMQNDKYAEQLNLHLSIFSKICKLGNDYYSFNKETRQLHTTATEVIDKQGDLAVSLGEFRAAYKQFLKAFYTNVFAKELDDNFIVFGDGIYVNDKYEREINLKEVIELEHEQLEIDYLMRWLGYDEKEARAIVTSRTDNEQDGESWLHNKKGNETDREEDQNIPE